MKNMNKTQFCALLEDKLKPYLSPKEMYKTLNFFEEMIDDRIDEGLSEEEAVSQLGDINIIVDQILDEHNIYFGNLNIYIHQHKQLHCLYNF